jgi:type I restriction enzyme S subunit
MTYKKIKLGDLLTESKIISESPNPARRITVRLKVLGVENRRIEDEVKGATKQFIRRAGQFIYGKQNFHKGAFGIVPPELDGFESSSDIPAFDVDESCLPEYIFYFFKQGNYYLELSKIASGVATQRINTSQLFEIPLLLPDIETQKRIITNIQIQESKGVEIKLEFNNQFTLVKKLRQQLLQDAVQGKLVSQNPKDEPASELFKRIKAEKAKLISEKKLKKEKELPPIKPEEIPFEIPENWIWCRLGEICTIKGGKRVANGYKLLKEPTPHIYIRVSDMKNGTVDDSDLHYLDESMFQKIKQYTISKDDIYMTIVGGTIGKCGLIPEKFHNMNLTENAAKISAILIDKFYLWKCLESPFCQDQFIDKTKQVGVQKMALNRFSNSLIPLPPLEEQHRIVQKLEESMQYCNELELCIQESESQNEKLLQQVLREAFRKDSLDVN